MPVNPDVLIVGGGVVGSACARELARSGQKVRVVDGAHDGPGWQAAAGLLAPQIEAGEDDPLVEIGLAGREWYVTHREELDRQVEGGIGLSLTGIVSLAVTADQEEHLKARVAWQRQHGMFCDWLSTEEVAEQWPWLAPARGALHAPEDGSLDPTRLVEALRADGQAAGVEFVADRIEALESVSGRVAGARGRSRYSAGTVVLAAGAWSGRITGLPRPVSVEPVRGQMVALPRPAAVGQEVIVYGYGHYCLTRGAELIAGSTMEHVGFAPITTEDGVTGILAGAGALCPPVRGTAPQRTWAGLRPGTPDGLPIIGPEPRLEGLWYATGHGRNGVLLAGITAVVLQQMMAGEATLNGIHAFRPERFWDW